MEKTRNRRLLIKRAKEIVNKANELGFILDWKRFGKDYEMIIIDVFNNQLIKEIKGFKTTTSALHSGFDFFEEIFIEKRMKNLNITY